jgi:hypothetical protein
LAAWATGLRPLSPTLGAASETKYTLSSAYLLRSIKEGYSSKGLILLCKYRYEKDVLLPNITDGLVDGLVRLDRLGSAPISRESGSTHKYFNTVVKEYPLDDLDRLAR